MAETTIYHLQMLQPEGDCSRPWPDGFQLAKVLPPTPTLNANLYRLVGGPWHWTDRLAWSREQWRRYVDRPELHTFVACCRGETAGYFELEQQAAGSVEIAYFGLHTDFIGRGFGRALLCEAIRLAWSLPGTRRLWVHTCTKDHPHALDNYLSRGFELFHTEVRREG